MTDVITIRGQQFKTLVAITANEAEEGLMFQSWPPPVMSFPFKKSGVRKFWMKNTLSPLDIVFCNNGKVIGVFAGQPLSLDNIGPEEPCDLVVEFPAGTAQSNNISVGDPVKLSLSIPTLAKKFENYLLFD